MPKHKSGVGASKRIDNIWNTYQIYKSTGDLNKLGPEDFKILFACFEALLKHTGYDEAKMSKAGRSGIPGIFSRYIRRRGNFKGDLLKQGNIPENARAIDRRSGWMDTDEMDIDPNPLKRALSGGQDNKGIGKRPRRF
jgi:hypothetical protein